jgi:hypothetical protein
MLSKVSRGQTKFGQVRTGLVRLGLDSSGELMLVHVIQDISGYVRLG